MNRWKEYSEKSLTPPVVVQHDYDGKEHLVWVWDGKAIKGPISRQTYDEAAIIAGVIAENKEVSEDAREDEGSVLKDKIVQLEADKAVLIAENKVLSDKLAEKGVG
jgi:hypothetical protein